MRCTVFSFLLVCAFVADAPAFTLQSQAKVNIVPGVEIKLMQDSGMTFAISGPSDLWAKVTMLELDEDILPPEISSQSGPADQLELTFPLAGCLQAPAKPWRSLLLRVEYE